MGNASKKTGKGRLDKYYKLAKEQGYRARSAFKLIQLNKKFSFLQTAKCCIDLCAAPGGWLQVASKYMPANSVIVGVDLVPIKPIPRVITFAADITTPQCRNLIRAELKNWKADVILHDGAPNVGTAWIQDAYCQSELVLMSLRLAVEFLIKGGTFVTKVFRSADYNNLIWVFNQLFGRVEATKPPSSRNVSAEIFVVCRDFLAPKYIDPKFLDPKHVFKELSGSGPSSIDKPMIAPNAEANVFQPQKKRRKRDGYEDGDYTLFKAITASAFVNGSDPISVLGTVNKISFETDEEKSWLAMDITTDDVKANCNDLKVLGKGDFKSLLKWRLALREQLGIDVKMANTDEVTETVEITEVVDEEQQLSNELERLVAEAAARTKRERRRANEKKTRTIQRMQLKMTAPLDIGLEQTDPSLGNGMDDMFDLGVETSLRKRHRISTSLVDRDEIDSDDSDDEGEMEIEDDDVVSDDGAKRVAGLEDELDGLYESYQERMRERDAKYRVKESKQKDPEREEWRRVHDSGSEDERSVGEGGWDEVDEAKRRFGEDSSSSEESDDDPDDDNLDDGSTVGRKHRRSFSPKVSKRVRIAAPKENARSAAASQVWFSQDLFSGIGDIDVEDAEDEGEDNNEHDLEWQSESDDGEDAITEVPRDDNSDDGDDVAMMDVESKKDDKIQKAKMKSFALLTPELVTLAQQLANREKTKTQLINDGFNRYSLNSKEGLPAWFLDDESKHYKPNIPITKEAVAALRSKQRALDARPIKKVAEAKARKKLRVHQRLEKAVKNAERVNATSDMSEREKAQQIEKLMRKGVSAGAKTKKQVKVVVAKGAHKGLKGRPKGVKGRYVMVDSRMKKEVRAKKRRAKAGKQRR